MSLSNATRAFIHQRFFRHLIKKTNNFGDVRWMGQPIWQNVLDLWTIQETIVAVRPDLLIECGTNRGGSSLFFAHLFDLLGRGRVITVDVEKLHDLSHPRISYLLGSSIDPGVVAEVRRLMGPSPGTVMVILDSDHSRAHVRRELETYAPFVSDESYLLCQDGVIDTLPMFRRQGVEGPLPAIVEFLAAHPEFEVDRERCERFLITHHPMGWLRRRRVPHGQP